MIPFVNLKAQYQSLKKEIDQAVARVLNSGWYLAGQETKSFEEEFARFIGAKYAVAVASGTDALLLSLTALEVSSGDEVITVPNTWVSTVSTIVATGAQPVFVDIDPKTFLIDTQQIEEKITKRTKAILPVHLYGLPVNMAEITRIAKKYHLGVVEDACQAHGARYSNKMVGTFSDLGCFSFHPTKNLGAFGDAGAIVTNNKILAQKIRWMRDFGRVKRDDHREKIFNSTMDELQAAILRAKLKKLTAWNKRRSRIAQIYNQEITASEIGKPKVAEKGEPAWHLYVVRAKHRNKLQQYLAHQGIQTLIHYPKAVYQQKSFAGLRIPRGACPQAEKLSSQILSLAISPELEPSHAQLIAQKINKYFRSIKNSACQKNAIEKKNLDKYE